MKTVVAVQLQQLVMLVAQRLPEDQDPHLSVRTTHRSW
jgi:hypothetical protein